MTTVSNSRPCIDRVLPARLAEEADEIAVAENPANAPPPAGADVATEGRQAALRRRLWKPGRTLKIRFLDGAASVQKRVREVAMTWTRYANIHFDFGAHRDADIRIAFHFAPDQNWSAIGTEALVERYFPRHQPTMSLGSLDASAPDREYSRLVLHEFGHALGCIHEHQIPEGGIEWNEDAVYAYYSGYPNYWSRDEIYSNVIEKYSEVLLNSVKFDERSIMLYEFPPELMRNRPGTSENVELSERDIEFIRARYPR